MFPKYPGTILDTNPTRSRSNTRLYTQFTWLEPVYYTSTSNETQKKMGCVVLGVLCSQNTLVLYCTQILRVVEVVLGSTQFIRLEPVY